jgi:hypothetical protein
MLAWSLVALLSMSNSNPPDLTPLPRIEFASQPLCENASEMIRRQWQSYNRFVFAVCVRTQ